VIFHDRDDETIAAEQTVLDAEVAGRKHVLSASRLQTKAVAALLSAPTLADAAAEVGVNERTLRNWLKKPTFKEAVKQAGREILGVTMSRLQAAAKEATETLLRKLRCGENSVEVRAAGLILANAFTAADLFDLQERVQALESAVGGAKNG
jgi:2-succinyl-5-enolpyruvyl-6-hydroxy-3-cyclohexene-1-carboxylate synthase